MFEYGLISSVMDQLRAVLSSFGDTFVRYGDGLLRFAVDNPFLFLLLLTGLLAIVLFTRLH